MWIGAALVLPPFIVLVIAQIAVKKFHPFVYWATIIGSTTLGTMLADFADRSLGIGYAGGSALLLFCVVAMPGALVPDRSGTVSVDSVNTPRVELFYWATITFSQTLGTALGDWMADDAGVGFLGGALIFWRGVGGGGSALFLGLRSLAVALFWLALHTHAAPLGGDCGRLSGQASQRGRFGPQPSPLVRGAHCRDYRSDPRPAAEGWRTSGPAISLTDAYRP